MGAGKADADVGLGLSFGIASRLIVGWFCIVIGLLNLLTEADRRTDPDVPLLIFQSMLVVGGTMLLALSWLAEDPGPAGYAVGGAVATIGLAGSAVPVLNSVCCMSAFGVRHGFPFTFLARHDGDAARWHVDSPRLIADLLFWGFTGLLALVAVALLRRFRTRHDDVPPLAPARNRHAELVAVADLPQPDPPLPADGTVSGHP